MYEPSLLASRASCQEKQASADVAGWPSDHFRSGRNLNVHDLPSAARSHDVAKAGIGSRFGPNPTSWS